MSTEHGVMTVWVRYTAPTLARLLELVSGLEHPPIHSSPDVMDDDVADLVFEVGSREEGFELASALERKLNTEGLEIARTSFFPKSVVS